MRGMMKKAVLMYVTRYGLEYVLSAKSVFSVHRTVSRCVFTKRNNYRMLHVLTLAMKLEAVHRITVVSSSANPTNLLHLSCAILAMSRSVMVGGGNRGEAASTRTPCDCPSTRAECMAEGYWLGTGYWVLGYWVLPLGVVSAAGV